VRALDALIALGKGIPIDLGQGGLPFVTQGKLIARTLVPPAQRGDRALDVGAGDGAQSRWLAERGYEVTSIDVEPEGAQAERVDADEPLPYPDGRFALVWCSEVIEHLRDPGFSLAEMRRVLAPGGTLLLTTPNSHAWFFRLLGALGLPPSRLQHPGHRYFWHLRDLRALCPEARILGYFPYLFVKRTIGGGLGLLTPTFVLAERRPLEPSRAGARARASR
jgi:SAM-dependent methyltransferase